jgi:hypothetical protein
MPLQLPDTVALSRVNLFVMLIVHFVVHCSSIGCGKSILNVRACVNCRLSPLRLLSSAIVLYQIYTYSTL